MAFVTDSGIYPMPVVQDFKRVGEGDTGPEHRRHGLLLPARPPAPVPLPDACGTGRSRSSRRPSTRSARRGSPYRGILYGGFMLTSAGPVLLEFNARFGDPESINVLPLYEPQNFTEVLHGVATGRRRPDPPPVPAPGDRWSATWCPPDTGSPDVGRRPRGSTSRDQRPRRPGPLRRGRGGRTGRFTMASSRALALVGEASAIHEAADTGRAGARATSAATTRSGTTSGPRPT